MQKTKIFYLIIILFSFNAFSQKKTFCQKYLEAQYNYYTAEIVSCFKISKRNEKVALRYKYLKDIVEQSWLKKINSSNAPELMEIYEYLKDRNKDIKKGHLKGIIRGMTYNNNGICDRRERYRLSYYVGIYTKGFLNNLKIKLYETIIREYSLPEPNYYEDDDSF